LEFVVACANNTHIEEACHRHSIHDALVECNIVLRVTAVAMSSKNLGAQQNSAQVVSNVSVAETCIPRNNEVLQNRVLQAMGRYFLKKGMLNARA